MSRISFVLPNLGIYGGIQSSIKMADALQRLGHDVSIIYPVIPGRDGLPWWNVRKWLVQCVRALQNIFFPARWFVFSGKLIPIPWSSEAFLPRADFLVLTWWADVEIFMACDIEKGRVIHFVRSYETWGGPPRRVEAVYRSPLPKVTTSEQMARQLAAVGARPLAIIPNGLDPVYFETQVEDQILHDSAKLRIGMLYRVQGWKRLNDGFAALTRIDEPFQLVLFGENLKASDRSGLDVFPDAEIHLLPTGKNLRDLYRSLDIFLFTSDETEAFGNPPLEAMACGCAVVSTRVGAIPAYARDNEHALLVAPGDVDAMVASVVRLIKEPGLRQQLAQNAKVQSRRYQWRSAAEQFEGVLDRLAST